MKSKFKVILMASFAVIFTALPLYLNATDIRELEAVLQTRVDDDEGLLLAVGIIEDNQSKFAYVSNPTDMQPEEFNEKSLFEIGSITKTFTGILLADMVLKGKVKLDDPVVKYLPADVTMPTYADKQITLEHLVTHTSCLPRLPTNLNPRDFANPYADYSAKQLYEFLSSYELTCEPGGNWTYSNLGMGLLGHVLSLSAKAPYEDLLKQHILVPLGMVDTVITLSTEQQQRLTAGHDEAGKVTSHWDYSTLAGAGALKSTPKDMMLYLAANMGMGETPLSDAIEMSHSFRYAIDPVNSIGLAWVTTAEADSVTIWHDGGTGGYRSYTGFDNKQRGVFVLANFVGNADTIGLGILNENLASLEINKESIELSQKNRDRLIGQYLYRPELDSPGITITISEENDNLFSKIDLDGEIKLPILAKSKTEFFFRYSEKIITFVEGENNQIDALIYRNDDGVAFIGEKL